MKTFFIVSDVHGFFDELQLALKESGYDITNPDHVFVLCGDLFDRGKKSKETYNFILSIPKDRRILIRGNHEYLLKEAFERKSFKNHDFVNGTAETCFRLSDSIYELNTLSEEGWSKIEKIVNWIDSDEWCDWYEIGDYILVHAFIPLKFDSRDGLYFWQSATSTCEYDENWRDYTWENHGFDLEQFVWLNPITMMDAGLFDEEKKKGKTLIVGHKFASKFHMHYDDEYNNYNIYYGDHIIAIDGATVLSKQVNVLKIEYSEDAIQLPKS